MVDGERGIGIWMFCSKKEGQEQEELLGTFEILGIFGLDA